MLRTLNASIMWRIEIGRDLGVRTTKDIRGSDCDPRRVYDARLMFCKEGKDGRNRAVGLSGCTWPFHGPWPLTGLQ
jgi:hypothetical protein